MTETIDFGDAEALSRPRIDPKPWMKKKVMELVTDATLPGIVDACIAAGKYSLDLEATGLDTRITHRNEVQGETMAEIVGVCLSPDGDHGYYVPVRHKVANSDGGYRPSPHNLTRAIVDREMVRLTASKAIAYFHHGKYDQELLEYNGREPWGDWSQPGSWEDSLILAYLRDTRARQKGLKYLSKTYLKKEMIELHELFGPDYKGPLDFSLLDPTWAPVLWYGCSDAICTFELVEMFLPEILATQKRIYTIEKGVVAATRWMERNLITVDRAKTATLIEMGQHEMYDAILDVYQGASELLGRDVMPPYIKRMIGNVVFDDPKFPLTAQIEIFRHETPQGKASIVSNQQQEISLDSLLGSSDEDLFSEAPSVSGKQWPEIYDIMSPQQLGPMFEELGVPGLVRTEKSKQVMTTKKELDRITETAGDRFPFMKRIKRFRETLKALSTYLLPLYEDSADRSVGPTGIELPEGLGSLHVSFDAHKVDTGRFSTPGKKIKHKGDSLHGGTRYPLHGTPSTADPNRPECLLRIRECLVARPRKWMAAIDFSGVELRIVTNYSREPLWIAEFFRCADCGKAFDRGEPGKTPEAPPPYCPDCGSDKIGDLHTLTGLSVYGAAAKARPDWKKLRGNSKGLNFALCYGGGGNAAMRAVGVDKNEGARLKMVFDNTYKGLATWWESQRSFARKGGFVETAFGRRYPVPDINSNERMFRSKAERNAVNGPVQAGSADITKIAMFLIFKEFKKRGWLNKAMMTITMHDELVFEIDEDIFEEAIEIIKDIMTRNPLILSLGWPVPLTVDVEFGKDWTVPYDMKKLARKGVPPELQHMLPKTIQIAAGVAVSLASAIPKGEKDKSSWSKAVVEVEGEEPEVEDLDLYEAEVSEEISLVADPLVANPLVANPLVAEPTRQERVSLPVEEGPVDFPQPHSVSAPVTVPVSAPVSSLAKGDTYTYRMRVSLTVGSLAKLSKLIHKCRGRGSRVLQIETKEGVVLPLGDLGQILVNDVEFPLFALDAGL